MALKSQLTLPVQLQVTSNHVTASLLGAPEIQAIGTTREAAIAALRVKIGAGVSEGDLTFIDIETGGVSALAGKYRDDPSLDDISQEAYQARALKEA